MTFYHPFLKSTEGLSQELKPKTMDLKLLILLQVDIWISCVKKKVLSAHKEFILSLPNIVLSILFVVGHGLFLLCRRHYAEVSDVEILK